MTNFYFMQRSCITPQHCNTATPLVIFAMLLLLCSNAFAQSGSPYKDQVDAVFVNLDKSPARIPTGILFEAGYNLVDVSELRGKYGNKAITFQTWKALYYSLFSAEVNTNNSFNKPLEHVEEVINSNPRTQIQIPIMRAEYNTIGYHAFSAEWLELDTIKKEVYDTPLGLHNNPYDTRTAFAVAPTQHIVTSLSAEFFFNPELFFTNTTATIDKIMADFDDGNGYQPYSLGDVAYITWTNGEPKNIKFIVAFSDGENLEANSDFAVNAERSVNARYVYPSPTTTIPVGIAGSLASGRLQISYADGNTTGQIRKPLIVLGGYDPFNTYDYKDFIKGIDLQTFFNNQLSGNIGQYDLVFLDYNHGGISIVDNAKLFQYALAYVNTYKQPLAGVFQQNVVMGISMGGLVARYGLAQMVRNQSQTGYNAHDTRLLITHDSPHQGANIPAAMQYVGRKAMQDAFLRIYVQPIQDLAIFADSPAAKEMLAYRAVSTTSILTPTSPVTFTANTFLPTIYHPMVDNLQTPYRFIATSQGSECGLGIVAPGASLFSSTGGAGTNVLWGTFSNTLGYTFNMNAANGTANSVLNFSIYNRTTLFSWAWGGITIIADVRALNLNQPFPNLNLDAQPGGITSTSQYRAALPTGTPAVFDLGIISFNASVSATIADGFCFVPRSSALDINSGNDPFSSFHGGYSNMIPNSLPYNPTPTNGYVTQEKVGGYPASQERRASNMEHTTFTDRQTSWLFDEMQSNAPITRKNCAVDQLCDEVSTLFRTPAITIGSTTVGLKIRQNAGGGYYVLNNSAINSYVWSISGSATITSGQGTPVVALGNLAGGTNYTLTVTVTSNCWTRTTSTTVTCLAPVATITPRPLSNITRIIIACLPAGKPKVDFTSGPFDYLSVTSVSLGMNNVNFAFPATGSVLVYAPSSPTTNPFAEITASGNVIFNRYGDYKVFAVNLCGLTSNSIFFRLLPDNGCRVVAQMPKTPTFIVSPNPSSGNEITIAQEISKVQSTSETSASGEEQPLAEAPTEAKNEEFTLILYNKLQIKVRETTLNTLSKTISTEGLPNDVYFLHIISKDGSKVVKQVMILR